MKILAIAGVPGVGKSTLMTELIQALGGRRMESRHRKLDYVVCSNVAVLGVYSPGEPFGGTDKLSMAVQPDAEEFLGLVKRGQVPGVEHVAFEGDRLCGGTFLRKCEELADEFRVLVLTADPTVLQERRAEREFLTQKTQDETWRRGRESKVEGIAGVYNAERPLVNTREHAQHLAGELRAWLGGEREAPSSRSIKNLSLLD